MFNFNYPNIINDMEAVAQGLQKLTETEEKIACLMKMDKVTQADFDKMLSKGEKNLFWDFFTDKINSSKGEDRDLIFKRFDEVIPKDAKNQLWENNHYLITVAISKHIDDYGKMPTKNQIASDSGLSRQTVYKHLNGYAEHPLYAEQLAQFKFMADRVLAKVIKLAGQGDVKAARLYFDVMGYLGRDSSSNTLIQTQNNYIQINGTVLRQESIKRLNPEQLNTIETILKTALPQSEVNA